MSMHPVILNIGPFPLHSYGLMVAIGFLTVLHFIQRDAKIAGHDPKIFADLAFVVLPLGLIGARIAHIMMFPEYYSLQDPLGWFAVWNGGLVFQGSPPIAIVYTIWYLKRHNISFWEGADIIFPYLALGHAIGRIGCLLYGCCFGAPTDSFWGIRFPRFISDGNITGSPAYLDHLGRYEEITRESTHSIAVYPTQVFSFIGLMVIFGLILAMRKYWKPFQGFTLPVYLMLYGIFRFWIEGLRGDHNPIRAFNLTDQQLFSLIGALIGLFFFVGLRKFQEKAKEKTG